MYGYTRLDRIRHEVTREKVRVASIEDKMRETRLRWFGHIKRRSENTPARWCETINVLWCERGRGRQKKSWNEVIRNYLNFVGVRKDMTQDSSRWRLQIKVAYHQYRASSPSFGFCLISDCCYVVLDIILSYMGYNHVG